MAATVTDDAILMLPNEVTIEGKQNIQALFETRFKSNSFKIVNTTLETEVMGDWAYVRGNFEHTVISKSLPLVGKAVEGSSKYLRVLKRQPDGSWKIYRSMNNRNESPA